MKYKRVRITDNLKTTSKDRYFNQSCDYKNKTSFDFYNIVVPHLKNLGCKKVSRGIWDIPSHLFVVIKNFIRNIPIRDGYGGVWFFKIEELE